MNPFWKNWSLGSKIGSTMTLLALVGIFGLNFVSIQREKVNFHDELQNQANLFLETMALTIRDPLYRLELDELNDLAQAVRDNEKISQLIIFDHGGHILVNSAQPELFFSQVPDPLGKTLISLPVGEVVSTWYNDELIAGQAIFVGNQIIGGIAVGFSTGPLDEKIKVMTNESRLVALIIIGLGSLLSFILARQITSPLGELTEVASHMGRGRSTRVQLKSADEIGKLGQVFNKMADLIEEREAALRDLAQGLENTVAERTAELEKMAISDPLTLVYNRRHFFTLAEKELERARQQETALAVILLDADHFKDINDTYGHQAGDLTLIELAKSCQEAIRKQDIFARYGGEEFILLMPDAPVGSAQATAERLRQRVAEKIIAVDGKKITITISLGVACAGSAIAQNITSLVALADQALYQSKQNGRNRVTVSTS